MCSALYSSQDCDHDEEDNDDRGGDQNSSHEGKPLTEGRVQHDKQSIGNIACNGEVSAEVFLHKELTEFIVLFSSAHSLCPF